MNDKKTDKESNILVAIRVRPLNAKEENNGDQDVIRVEDKLMVKREEKKKEKERRRIMN